MNALTPIGDRGCNLPAHSTSMNSALVTWCFSGSWAGGIALIFNCANCFRRFSCLARPIP